MAKQYRINGIDFDDYYLREEDILEGMVGNQLWSAGSNTYGGIGDNTRTVRSSPVQTITAGTNWVQGTVGDMCAAAVKSDGTLWTWGYNVVGGLGTGNTTHRSSPVQTVAGGNTWRTVAAGAYHMAAIKTDGTLWAWGSGTGGELGDNANVSRSSPVQTVAGGNVWKSVVCGDSSTYAIKTDNTLWVWGINNTGQLGTNNITSYSSPVQTVAGGTNWKQVSAATKSVYQGTSTGAVKTDGTLWMWGLNAWGQLGTNNITYYSSPVQTVAGGTNWKQVSCGYYHTAAVKTDGTLWLWGQEAYGELGNNSNGTPKSSPVQTVAGGTNWKQVSCGNGVQGDGYGPGFTAAIKTDGSLWVWGDNTQYQLGTGNNTTRSSPVQTAAGGTNWKMIDVGSPHWLAITYAQS